MCKRDGEYWDSGWNPIKAAGGGFHCTKCSPGCLNCWAENINIKRMGGRPYDGTKTEFVLDEKTMQWPTSWGKERTIFVCHLCDLFHEDIPDSMIERVFQAMELADWHKYLVLTKRPERLEHFLAENRYPVFTGYPGPREHIWIGTTVCNQAEVDEKIPILIASSASHRWLSIEPMLEPITLRYISQKRDETPLPSNLKIDWVTVGAESLGFRMGRPSNWFTEIKPIVEQCKAAKAPPCFQDKTGQGGQTGIQGIPVWVKQIHYQNRLVRNNEELPVDVRFRERPF